MPSVNLKQYQTLTLETLSQYLKTARVIGAAAAFDKIDIEPKRLYAPPSRALFETPYCCLRLPTGGGKTLLSAHSIKIACEQYLEKEYPMVLWLVPSNTIRAQTLETLKSPDNANYQALYSAFGSNFMVIDIADFTQIRAHEIGNKTIIIIATIQTLKVDSKAIEARKVYAHNENLEPHFAKTPKNFEGFETIEEGKKDAGKIRFSFANLLRMHRPLVLVDEAHNNATKLAFETFERISPECIIEFTATPASNSNIIHRVSAIELKNEEMIKLPIVLTEHSTWQSAVHDSIKTRAKLEEDAKSEREYIRPIVLFQAENQGNENTWQILREHLIENENIAPEKIAIVTGDQRELDGINLFDPNCPIEFIITVQALKEGWDCSFAYVFCSLANINSSKDVEQLLGRVLRMPYARRRTNNFLNKAYTHVCRTSWPNAISRLSDKLVDGMGFEQFEAMDSIEIAPPSFELVGGNDAQVLKPVEVPILAKFDISDLPEEERKAIVFEKREDGVVAIISAQISPQIQEVITNLIPKENDWAAKDLQYQQLQFAKQNAPVNRGEIFQVPQLVLDFFGEYQEPDDEALIHYGNWNIAEGIELKPTDFSIREEGVSAEIDILGGKVIQSSFNKSQLDFDQVEIGWTLQNLAIWLSIRLQRNDLSQAELLSGVRKTLEKLVETPKIELWQIAKFRFVLAQVLEGKIKDLRKSAKASGYQRALFEELASPKVDESNLFEFKRGTYFPKHIYEGRKEFAKHFFGSPLGKMNKEEVDCALQLEMNPKVKFFVRNLESDINAFRIATKSGYMYPDFVALLHDGRTLVVEYKGADRDNSDTAHKEDVGKLWERKSKGRGVFIIGWKKHEDLTIAQQIDKAIG